MKLEIFLQTVNPFLFTRGFSCPLSVHTSLIQNFLQLTIPGFPYSLLSISCGAFTSLEPSFPLQAILLSDLVSVTAHSLQIVMAFWRAFLKFEVRQTVIIVSSGLPHLTQQVQIFFKCAKRPLLSAAGCHTRLHGQHENISQGFFKGGETSEDITRHLFLIK
jgi:hypothetical protein